MKVISGGKRFRRPSWILVDAGHCKFKEYDNQILLTLLAQKTYTEATQTPLGIKNAASEIRMV
ncbi:hypothetical protein MUK42_35292 [Musa troglodytarum]|uniref:Uncharacterized protein n=1 Tax=Musa troglodytarum TaxID=320322 RepID=A0A9E7G0K4_9LILI|nr:hypothetical protein MUK42_35292 [Musa troglodytarum]